MLLLGITIVATVGGALVGTKLWPRRGDRELEVDRRDAYTHAA